MSQPVFKAIDLQHPGHCGPASLAMCLGVLGIDASQRDLARAAGKEWKAYTEGLDEHDLERAARAHGVECELVEERSQGGGQALLARLREALRAGTPLLLLVDDFIHWVSVIAYVDGRFVIMDPNQEDEVFSRWTEKTLLLRAWNVDYGGDEPSQYFAIVTRRADGKPPFWKVTEAFIRLCEVGAEETAEQMADDLSEIIARSRRDDAGRGTEGPALVDLMNGVRDTVIDNLWHWTADTRVSKEELASVYDDYMTIAQATSLRCAAATDQTALVAQLTAILAAYVWNGEL